MEYDDAIHGDCKGQQGFGGRRHAEHGTAGKFNEEMAKAGVIQAGEGLHPSAKGARLKYSGGKSTVSRGPFNFTSDLVCGFWLIQTKSLDEAIDWMKRAPFDGGAEIEIRQVFATEDFGEAVTPELREQEGRLRARTANK